jgi:hypothetical protein
MPSIPCFCHFRSEPPRTSQTVEFRRNSIPAQNPPLAVILSAAKDLLFIMIIRDRAETLRHSPRLKIPPLGHGFSHAKKQNNGEGFSR